MDETCAQLSTDPRLLKNNKGSWYASASQHSSVLLLSLFVTLFAYRSLKWHIKLRPFVATLKSHVFSAQCLIAYSCQYITAHRLPRVQPVNLAQCWIMSCFLEKFLSHGLCSPLPELLGVKRYTKNKNGFPKIRKQRAFLSAVTSNLDTA